MLLQYLGTAAAEAIPALFCECPVCEQARKAGGKAIRGRSGALLDGRLMIDFPPDIYMQSLRFGLSLASVEALIVTHSHSDHLGLTELMLRDETCFCHILNQNKGKPLPVYGNARVGEMLAMASLEEFDGPCACLSYHPVKPFDSFALLGYQITALPARHKPNEKALFYLIQRDGKALLYAHDTGDFPEEVYAYLAEQRILLNTVSLDCTNFQQREGSGHMGIPNDLDVMKRLREQQNVNDETKAILNHFSHNCALPYEEMADIAEKNGFVLSYDGMQVTV